MPAENQSVPRVSRCGLRTVAIGGGTGLSTLLRGLKRYTALPGEAPLPGTFISDLTAVVTVSDDGGSSGRLRRELRILPPGDIRNCLVAVSEDENLIAKLFRHRFTSSGDLEGHSFGNLFLAALTAITGDFAEAVKCASEILSTRAHILPATSSNIELEATMNDGSLVSGETNITASEKRVTQIRLVPGDAKPLPQTLDAIAKADLITIGPGSLFTSLIPNVLVHGIAEAIAASQAVKVFICNLMTEANESLNLTASQHIAAILAHAQLPIFDFALVNSAPVSAALLEKYAEEQASQVECDCPAIEALGVKCRTGNFVQENDVARHATDRLSQELLRLADGARASMTSGNIITSWANKK
jgi:uncharacterized cofD-like protein